MFKSYTAWWKETPKAIRIFLFKGLLLLVVWKAVYVLYLGPSGVLDKPLTTLVGRQTTTVLNAFTSGTNYSNVLERFSADDEPDQLGEPLNAVIYCKGRQVLTVANACNGLELFVLYIGFLICMPASFLRILFFLVSGVLAIHILNVMRCAGLGWLSSYHPGLLNFAHHYLFKIILYSVILIFWLLFTKQNPFRFELKGRK